MDYIPGFHLIKDEDNEKVEQFLIYNELKFRGNIKSYFLDLDSTLAKFVDVQRWILYDR